MQVTSPGDDLRRPRLSSKASLDRRSVHTRRLRDGRTGQPPIKPYFSDAPSSERELCSNSAEARLVPPPASSQLGEAS